MDRWNSYRLLPISWVRTEKVKTGGERERERERDKKKEKEI
jgi:hypothetical protein